MLQNGGYLHDIHAPGGAHVTRFSTIGLLMLAMAAAGCGSAGTSEVGAASSESASPAPTLEPTPTPTPKPTPTVEPTPDAAAFADLYQTLSADIAVELCQLSDTINADSGNPAVWQQGITGQGQAWATMADRLREADVPASVESDVDALIVGIAALVASSQAIAAAPADMDVVFPLYESEFVTIQQEQLAPAADAIRTALELPPRPQDPCS